MPDLYLIAHKVRGEPAFDVAQRLICPECDGDIGIDCHECQEGWWWIIPTSGHRAYPYWHIELDELRVLNGKTIPGYAPDTSGFADDMPVCPEGWPDHYPCNKSPDPPRPGGLLSLLGLRVPTNFKRRV